MKSTATALLASCAAIAGLMTPARADILVSVGYYDLGRDASNPPCCGNTNAVPDPWIGSPNTVFDGDAGVANAGDPDESGILFQNTGGSAVTISAISITWGGSAHTPWDSFLSQSIAGGTNLIFSGTSSFDFDGSDAGIIDAKIDFTIEGTNYSVTDSASVLDGFPAFDETMPWTQLSCIGTCGSSTIPEPGVLTLLGPAFLGLTALRRRRKA